MGRTRGIVSWTKGGRVMALSRSLWRVLFASVLILSGGFACGEDKEDTAPPSDGDADTDTDVDSPTDTGPFDADGDGVLASEDCDDNDPSVGLPSEWYQDADGDGYGNASSSSEACTEPSGFVADDTDCDDENADIHPGAVEYCDGVDSDCDGLADEDEHESWGDGIDNNCDGEVDTESLADAGAKLMGEAATDSAGSCVAAAGDMNRDGYDDVLVAATANDRGATHSGAVYLFHGPLQGDYELSEADAILTLGVETAQAGDALVGGLDLNGDANLDVVVRAQHADYSGGWSWTGDIYLVHGPVTGDVDLELSAAVLVGEEPGDDAGLALAHAGDLDGDGCADLVIGARDDATGGYRAGAVYVAHGTISGTVNLGDSHAKFYGELVEQNAGSDVDGAGDVNADGYDDLLVGARYDSEAGEDAGAAYLVLGPISGGEKGLESAEAKLVGEAADSWAGSVAGVGDIDGDGRADVLVGAHRDDTGGTDAGAAYLLLGSFSGTRCLSTADAKYVGEEQGDWAGARVASAGDVDGDGSLDLLIGAYEESTGGEGAGAVYLVSGQHWDSRDLSSAAGKLLGEAVHDTAGIGMSPAGDVDGDGLDDLLVGSHSNDENAEEAGAAYLIYGR